MDYKHDCFYIDGPNTATLIPATVTYTREELSSMPPIACFCGKSYPDCRIEWTANGTYISNDSILRLGNVDRNTTGHYVCTCTNPSTQTVATQHFNLSIRCKYTCNYICIAFVRYYLSCNQI